MLRRFLRNSAIYGPGGILVRGVLAALLLNSAARRDLVLLALPVVIGSGVFYLLQSQPLRPGGVRS